MPISSRTSACRILVIKLYLAESSQIIGLVMSRGGYINHNRRFSLEGFFAVFFFFTAFFRVAFFFGAISTAGNGRDNAHLVTVL